MENSACLRCLAMYRPRGHCSHTDRTEKSDRGSIRVSTFKKRSHRASPEVRTRLEKRQKERDSSEIE